MIAAGRMMTEGMDGVAEGDEIEEEHREAGEAEEGGGDGAWPRGEKMGRAIGGDDEEGDGEEADVPDAMKAERKHGEGEGDQPKRRASARKEGGGEQQGGDEKERLGQERLVPGGPHFAGEEVGAGVAVLFEGEGEARPAIGIDERCARGGAEDERGLGEGKA